MNYKQLPTIMSIALQDKEGNLELLKQELTANEFKHTTSAAFIMLDEMSDLGLEDDAVLYWKTLALSL